MAHSNQSIVESRLTNLSDALRSQYDPEVPDMAYRLGSPTSRIIRPSDRVTMASDWYQMVTGHADSSRAGKSLDADFGAPRKGTVSKIQIRLDEQVSAANDFRRVDAIARLSRFDVMHMNNPESAVNIAEKVTMDSTESVNETSTILMHADKTAQIGTVDGTPKNNDSENFSAATTYTSGATEARITLAGNSVGIYSPNMYLDFYTSAGVLIANGVRITDVNVSDYSCGLALTDESNQADLDNLADTHYIYRSGEKDCGFLGGFGEAMKGTIASGDSWFGGVDRSTSSYRHLLPVKINSTGSATAISKSHLDQMASKLGYRMREESGVATVWLGGVDLAEQLRQDIGNEALVNTTAEDNGQYTFGELGVTYMHPTVGRVTILGDAAAKNDKCMLLNPEDWEMLHGYSKGIEIVTGGAGMGDWERVPGENTVGGGSMYYRREGYSVKTPYCKKLNRQALLDNMTGTGAATP